jgi:hypothetical protein
MAAYCVGMQSGINRGYWKGGGAFLGMGKRHTSGETLIDLNVIVYVYSAYSICQPNVSFFKRLMKMINNGFWLQNLKLLGLRKHARMHTPRTTYNW